MVAGESANDREVLRCFLEEFCPEMQGRIVFLNDKVPLCVRTSGPLAKQSATRVPRPSGLRPRQTAMPAVA